MSGDGFTVGGLGAASHLQKYNRVGVRYPSPFFDLSQVYLPKNMRALFRWAKYYALTYGPVYAYVTKMASYSLTELVWGSDADSSMSSSFDEDKWKKRWSSLMLEDMLMYEKCYQFGLHYYTFGNAYVSIHYPFDRWLICPKCGFRKRAREFRKKEYRWVDFRFHGECRKCGTNGPFKVKDQLVRTSRGLRIKIWNPERVLTFHNDATDETEYKYQPSEQLMRRVRRGDRRVIERTPWAFIAATKKRGLVTFDKRNFVHVKAPSPDGESQGLGHPPILAALKDIFHVQLMKRAQEANAIERTIPLTMIHPLPMGGGEGWNPMMFTNLTDLLQKTQEEVSRARMDPNYIPFSPVPMGVTPIWGDGRNLLLVPEIRGWTEMIVADLAVPTEFIFGGLQWSGSNVSLRMLENQILSFTSGYKRLTKFVVESVARFLKWPIIPYAWTPFKMADDIQLKQHALMLSQMNKIGDSTLLGYFGKNPSDEHDDIKQSLKRQSEYMSIQMVEQARAQAEAAEVQQKAQMSMQQEMGMQQPGMEGQPGAEQGMPPTGEEDPQQFAMRMAEQLAPQPDEVIEQTLTEVAQQSPELAQQIASMVEQIRAQGGGQEEQPQEQGAPQEEQMQPGMMQPGMQPGGPGFGPGTAPGAQMMQPQPQQLPPRRGPGSAAI